MYTDKPGLPKIVREAIMTTFQELSDEPLLKRCLHGLTQNNNESINGIIWNIMSNFIPNETKTFVPRDPP